MLELVTCRALSQLQQRWWQMLWQRLSLASQGGDVQGASELAEVDLAVLERNFIQLKSILFHLILC